MEDTKKVGDEPKKKTVQEVLAEMQKTMEKLSEENAKLIDADSENKKKIEMLLKISDEGRKENFDAKNRVRINPKVYVTMIDKKIIVASKTITDEVYRNPDGKWFENQIHEYTFEDGSTKIINLPEYTRTREKVLCDVVRVKEIPEKMSDDGTKYFEYEVKLPDERTLTLDYKFIN